MRTLLSYRVLIMATFGLLSIGCSPVYIPNGLPDKHRADIPELEGYWEPDWIAPQSAANTQNLAPSDDTTEDVLAHATRIGKGHYLITFVDKSGDTATFPEARVSASARGAPPGGTISEQLEIDTYIINNRIYASVTSFKLDQDNKRHRVGPFPLLVQLSVTDNSIFIRSARDSFFGKHPRLLDARWLGAPEADSPYAQDLIITDTPERLANFLVLHGNTAEAWTDQDSLSKHPGPRRWWSWLTDIFRLLWAHPFLSLFLFGMFFKTIPSFINLSRSAAGGIVNALTKASATVVSGQSFANGSADGTIAEKQRLAWVCDAIQFLIRTAQSSPGGGPLSDHARRLIINIAQSEAKRVDAFGHPLTLTKNQISQLVWNLECNPTELTSQFGLLSDSRNAAIRTRFVKRIWQLIVHDGPATEEEVAFAQEVANSLNMTSAESLAIAKRFYRPPRNIDDKLDDAYKLLGLNRIATAEDIKRAYKRKAREYHPDAHAGVSENLKALAAEHFKKITAAYEQLLESTDHTHLVTLNSNGEFASAKDPLSQVKCFVCGSIQPGPSVADSKYANCPRCFTLLYHDLEFATELRQSGA